MNGFGLQADGRRVMNLPLTQRTHPGFLHEIGGPYHTGLEKANLMPVRNVRAYGAKGDGTTDDTAAIRRAADAATGSTLFFPEGTYLCSAVALSSSTLVCGEGAGSIVKLNANTSLFTASSKNDITIRDLTLDGDRANRSTGSLMALTDVARVRVFDCNLVESPSAGIVLTRAEWVWVDRCRFKNLTHSGIRWANPGAGNANRYLWVRGCRFEDCNISASAGHAAVMMHDLASGSVHEYAWIEDNYVHSPGSVGIGVCADVAWVQNNRVLGDGSPVEGIAVTGNDIAIVGNVVEDHDAGGILLFAMSYGNTRLRVTGNVCHTNAQGLALVWGEDSLEISDVVVTDNRFYSNNYGIQSYLAPGVTGNTWKNILIANNNLIGNTTAAHALADPNKVNRLNNFSSDSDRTTYVDQTMKFDRGLEWNTDNTWDIGNASSARPRDVNVARNVKLGGSLTVGASITGGFVSMSKWETGA